MAKEITPKNRKKFIDFLITRLTLDIYEYAKKHSDWIGCDCRWCKQVQRAMSREQERKQRGKQSGKEGGEEGGEEDKER